MLSIRVINNKAIRRKVSHVEVESWELLGILLCCRIRQCSQQLWGPVSREHPKHYIYTTTAIALTICQRCWLAGLDTTLWASPFFSQGLPPRMLRPVGFIMQQYDSLRGRHRIRQFVKLWDVSEVKSYQQRRTNVNRSVGTS